MKQLIIFLLSPLFLFSQIQIGNDIDGVASGDNSGNVSLSSDGTIVAIGGPGNDTGGTDAGHVRVFKNKFGVWTQIGDDMVGEAVGHNFGASVSLSSDGSIVAIGSPGSDASDTDPGYARVFENISGTWTQVGGDISREIIEDRFGLLVSLSNDGTKLAISGYTCCGIIHGNPSVGYTRVYENISGDWTPIGEEISTGFNAISDVSLSADGEVVAIASPSGGLSGWSNYFSGGVKVYQNRSGVWRQIGQTFIADDCYWCSNYLGGVSLANNSSKLAIVDSFNIRVYEFIDDEWIQQGVDIESENYYSKISLSNDGTILAVGGSVARAYQNSSGNWMQLGIDIINEEAEYYDFEFSLELSSDGKTLIVGAPQNDGNEIDSGHVRVYDLSTLLSVEKSSMVSVKLYPNPASNQFTITLPDDQNLKKMNIYNKLGQFIHTSETSIVKTLYLASGLYYVEVITNKGKATKKLIVE